MKSEYEKGAPPVRAIKKKTEKNKLKKPTLLVGAAVAGAVILVSIVITVAIAIAAVYRESKDDIVRYDNDGEVIELPDWIEEAHIPINDYSRPGKKTDDIVGIVVHYVANPGTTAEANRNYFAGLATSGATYASSNFIIGPDGKIIECVPLGEVAYCSNNRNSDTVSIECCHPDESGKFTAETYESLVKLCRWLCDVYGIEEGGVIRHYDVTGKMCPLYFVEHEDEWLGFLSEVHGN